MSIQDTEIKDAIWEFFPKKDDGYREYQEATILKIVKTYLNGRKFCIIDAPTGAGKSVTAYTALKTIHHFDNGYRKDEETDEFRPDFQGPYGLMSVHTRALQVQYANTFPDVPLIWSGTHYTCAVEPKNEKMYWGCGECPKKRCIQYENCDYADALGNFLEANIGITNYAYYLHAPFLRPFISVIDECHNLEDVLCEWAKVELSTKYLTQLLLQLRTRNLVSSVEADSIQQQIRSIIFINDHREEWLQELRSGAGETIRLIQPVYRSIALTFEMEQKQFKNPKSLTPGQRNRLQLLERASRYFRNFLQKLALLNSLETSWVISHRTYEDSEDTSDKTYPKVEIKPLYIHEVSHAKLFSRSHFFLFMSATVCGPSVFMKYLGIQHKDAAYFQVPSTFPVENRPVYAYSNLGAFTYKTRENILPLFTSYVDDMLEKGFEGVRGIIHSVSYENALYIKEKSRNVERMVFPESEDLLNILDLLSRKEDTIVVSPSVVEGLDLKDDLCRFAIFLKFPWASRADKWIEARMKDSEWYARAGIIKVVQGSGRGTRKEDDHSVVIIMDKEFSRVWKSHQDVFPTWYQNAVKFIEVQAPPKENDL